LQFWKKQPNKSMKEWNNYGMQRWKNERMKETEPKMKGSRNVRLLSAFNFGVWLKSVSVNDSKIVHLHKTSWKACCL
jgi:hypothetical protein